MALVKLNSNISFGEVIGIYVLEIENLFYVGSSRRLYERVCHHTKSLRMGTYKERPLLQEAYDSNNEHNYKVTLYSCPIEELYEAEEFITKKYKKEFGERCVNLAIGKKHSKETIKNIKASIKANGGRGGENNGSHKITWKGVNEIRKK